MSEEVDLRVSDREREEMVTRLQVAFAEGRLDDEEFDTRVRSALAAKTRSQLDAVAADLPAESVRASALVPAGSLTPSTSLSPAGTHKPGKLSLAYKTSLRRGGRWRVPAKFTAVSYKGGGTVIDLRAAELTSAVTTIRAVAYKCRVQVLVPPGMRVEFSGIGVTNAEDAASDAWPADGPAVHVRGIAYKGLVEIRTMPAGAH
ncbi:MAG TPA: DUF1707 domain-containing protein [Actinocrinis sp.]|uniref:DUF1707 SHOCT-like domain-containing protein n=1 Tax=Actinocrinis sp. TaxID=1920516 RepID=UPI002D26F75B|nr:DUF1707 domain-containing protein [Actinocrinis sp.]HZU54861.1 DUF1707 domain-containing protein [Actinocrinis sp.]